MEFHRKQCKMPHQYVNYFYYLYNVINFLFNPVMATIPNTTPIPTSNSTSEDTQTSGTDLSNITTEDEMNTNISKWTDKERKKLQHMKEFHEEYQ